MPDTTLELGPHGYPASWPKRNPLRPTAIVSLVTDQQKLDLYVRNITTRQLAQQLRVKETYLSFLFPGKEPARSKMKQALRGVRLEYRMMYAQRVIDKELSITQASELSKVSYRTLARAVQSLREVKHG
jgi:transposase-like protein